MSLDATRWAWLQDLRPSHKLVLLSLADRAGEMHECYPAFSRLEKDTGLHKETIIEAINQLQKIGIITISRTDGKVNKYKLIGVEGRNDADQYGKPDRKSSPVFRTTLDLAPTSMEKRTTPVRKTGLPPVRKTGIPILESTNESTKEPTKVVAGLDPVAWDRWEKYRIDIKKPIKKPSILAAQKMLSKYGDEQSAVVEQSIAQGWQGLFDIKPENSHQVEKAFKGYIPGAV